MSDYNDTSRYRLPANLRQQVGLGRISADARDRGVVRSGLGIESIERAFLNGTHTLSADLTGLNASTFTLVDATNLAWDVWFSGKRPVVMTFQGLVQYITGGGYIALSMMLDGVELTSAALGMWYTDVDSEWRVASGTWVIDEIVPGRHRIGLAYKVFSAGSLTVSSGVPVVVTVREV